ncbi:MAG: WbqC family protein [Bacteroidales bacterium]|jgi:hypothetical protein|nr:WbqC family protein [Bacteroidales bacterium]
MSKGSFAVFPTAFFPSVAYLAALKTYDEVAVEGFESFEKQTYRNRAYILAANGVQPLNVPLQRSHKTKQQTNEIRISYAESWNKKHWRAISSAYGKSPFFEYYAWEVEPFFSKRYDLLLELNNDVLTFCKKHFAIQTEILATQNYQRQYANDFREAFKVQKQGREQGFYPPYYQCFSDKVGFCQNLSCLDLLFCLGKQSQIYLQSIDWR